MGDGEKSEDGWHEKMTTESENGKRRAEAIERNETSEQKATKCPGHPESGSHIRPRLSAGVSAVGRGRRR